MSDRRIAVALLCLSMTAAAPPPACFDAEGLPLPSGAVARLGSVRLRHGREVRHVALSADTRRTATVNDDAGEVVVWDNATGRVFDRFSTREGQQVARLTFAGNRLHVAYADQPFLDVWDGRTRDVRRLDLTAAGAGRSLAVRPDGGQYACAGKGGAVVLIDADKSRATATLPSESDGAVAAEFSPDGSRLGVLYQEGGFVLWDVARRAVVKGEYRALSLADEASRLVFFSAGGRVAVVDNDRIRIPCEGKDVGPSYVVPEGILAVGAGTAKGELLILRRDGRVRRLNVDTGRVAAVVAEDRDEVRCGTVAGGIVVLCRLGYVRHFDGRTGKPLFAVTDPPPRMTSVCATSDGKARVADGEGRVMTWDLSTSRAVGSTEVFSGRRDAFGVTFDRRGTRALVEDYLAERVTTFDLPSGKALTSRATTSERGARVGVSLSRDGTKAAEISNSGRLAVRDAATGRVLTSAFVSPLYDYGAPVWSEDGRYLLATRAYGGTAVYDAADGRERHRRAGAWSAACFRPDGRVVALADDERIHLVPLAGGRATFLAHGSCYSLRYSPDGALIAAARGDFVRLWREDGREVAVFRGHLGSVNGLAFTPDGRFLITASDDGTCLVWRVPADTDAMTDLQ